MEVNISKTTVWKYREVEGDIKEVVDCNDIKCYLVDCHECIFNIDSYTIEELKKANRLR